MLYMDRFTMNVFILKNCVIDGPPLPPEDKFPIELVAIITGTCAGVLLIIVIITVIACCVVRKSPTNKLPRDADTRPTLSPVGDKVY